MKLNNCITQIVLIGEHAAVDSGDHAAAANVLKYITQFKTKLPRGKDCTSLQELKLLISADTLCRICFFKYLKRGRFICQRGDLFLKEEEEKKT